MKVLKNIMTVIVLGLVVMNTPNVYGVGDSELANEVSELKSVTMEDAKIFHEIVSTFATVERMYRGRNNRQANVVRRVKEFYIENSNEKNINNVSRRLNRLIGEIDNNRKIPYKLRKDSSEALKSVVDLVAQSKLIKRELAQTMKGLDKKKAMLAVNTNEKKTRLIDRVSSRVASAKRTPSLVGKDFNGLLSNQMLKLYGLFLAFGVIGFIILAKSFNNKENKVKKKRIREIRKVEGDLDRYLDKSAVIVLNSTQKIVKWNEAAEKLFAGKIKKSISWDGVFKKAFFKGKSLFGQEGYYRNRYLPQYIFAINAKNIGLGRRMLEITKFPIRDLVQTADHLNQKLIKTDTLNIFDEALSQVVGHYGLKSLVEVFNRVQFKNGADLVFMTENESRSFMRSYMTIVGMISENKPNSRIGNIEFSRNSKGQLQVKTDIENCNMSEGDFGNIVLRQKSVAARIEALKSSFPHYIEGFFVKSKRLGQASHLEIVTIVNDLARESGVVTTNGQSRVVNASL